MKPKTKIKPIPGFEGYFAGANGSIWSFLSRFGGRGKKSWKQLKGTPTDSGYLSIGLRESDQRHHRGKVRVRPIHYWVLLAFVGPKPMRGMIGRHLDDNRQNNKISNLKWGTRRDNVKDAHLNKRFLRGDEAPATKLTNADRKIVRHLIDRGSVLEAIAVVFRVSYGTILKVKNDNEK